MRSYRAIPAITAVLLTAACTSSSSSAPISRPSTPAPGTTTAAPLPRSSPTASPTLSGAAGHLQVAIPAAKLPYRPAKGAPALGDVRILKSASDPCTVPADDSGNEAQLINASLDVNVVIVTFEFTNPCSAPLTYNIAVTQAIGSAAGPSGGPSTQTSTPLIDPGQSISFHVNVDPSASLTSTQLQDLWVGVTRITKGPAT